MISSARVERPTPRCAAIAVTDSLRTSRARATSSWPAVTATGRPPLAARHGPGVLKLAGTGKQAARVSIDLVVHGASRGDVVAQLAISLRRGRGRRRTWAVVTAKLRPMGPAIAGPGPQRISWLVRLLGRKAD